MPITTATGLSAPTPMSEQELALRQKELDEKVQAANEARAEEEPKPDMPITGKDNTPEQTLREVVSASDRGPTIANPASQPIIDSGVFQTAAKQQTPAEPPSEEQLATSVDASTGVQTFKPQPPEAEPTSEAELTPETTPAEPPLAASPRPAGYTIPPLP